MFPEDEENEHPADAFINASVDSVMAAGSPEETVKVLGMLAGGTDKAFFNAISNTDEVTIRLALFKILREFHEIGQDDTVMDILDFLAKGSLVNDPGLVDRARDNLRKEYDEGLGL